MVTLCVTWVAPAQSVAVREVEKEKIANVLWRNGGEKTFDLLFRVVLDRPLLARSAKGCSASSATRRRALPAGMNGDFAGNPGFH
jgi:hypothetical protein